MGLFLPPEDLQAFVGRNSERHIAVALGVSRGTAINLRNGRWPRHDGRALIAAWDSYRGRTATQASRWFMRRVYHGGVVLHAGKAWHASGLEERIGDQVAVARSKDGLLVHTLELPAQRFELVPMEGTAA